MFDMESFLAGLSVGRILWNPAKGGIYGRAIDPPPDEAEDIENTEESDAV